MTNAFLPGMRVRLARKERGWTLDRLADLSGVDKSQVSRFENGERLEMSVAQLAKIVRALGVSLDAIWFGPTDASALDPLSSAGRETLGKLRSGEIDVVPFGHTPETHTKGDSSDAVSVPPRRRKRRARDRSTR